MKGTTQAELAAYRASRQLGLFEWGASRATPARSSQPKRKPTRAERIEADPLAVALAEARAAAAAEKRASAAMDRCLGSERRDDARAAWADAKKAASQARAAARRAGDVWDAYKAAGKARQHSSTGKAIEDAWWSARADAEGAASYARRAGKNVHGW